MGFFKFIIHLCGGYTRKDTFDIYNKALNEGIEIAANGLKKHSEEIYGCDSDTWCKEMYDHINHLIDSK